MSRRGNFRASVDTSAPEPFGACDRCGFVYNLSALSPQMEWSGRALRDTGWLVCSKCLDEPNPQLKTQVLPPDPVPVRNARPAPWATQLGDEPAVQTVVDILSIDD